MPTVNYRNKQLTLYKTMNAYMPLVLHTHVYTSRRTRSADVTAICRMLNARDICIIKMASRHNNFTATQAAAAAANQLECRQIRPQRSNNSNISCTKLIDKHFRTLFNTKVSSSKQLLRLINFFLRGGGANTCCIVGTGELVGQRQVWKELVFGLNSTRVELQRNFYKIFHSYLLIAKL